MRGKGSSNHVAVEQCHLSVMMTSEQTWNGVEVSTANIREKSILTSADVLRYKCIWLDQEAARRPLWIEQHERLGKFWLLFLVK